MTYEYKNQFITTGKVLTDPFKPFNRQILEFDILYKEKTKYRINISFNNLDFATFVHTSVKKDMMIDVAGKIQLIAATSDYAAYILIHADRLKIISN